MSLPDLQFFGLNDNVFPEPNHQKDRIVLWISGPCAKGYQEWQRVSSVPRSVVRFTQGICSIESHSVLARQRTQGFLTRLLRFRSTEAAGQIWLLPNGSSVEQWGSRRTDQLLAWSEDVGNNIDETRLRSIWTTCSQVEGIGNNLFLLTVALPKSDQSISVNDNPTDDSLLIAKRNLALARAGTDRHRLALALADLGAIYVREKESAQALPILEEVLLGIRHVGDRFGECDILCNLGSAQLELGHQTNAVEFFERALAVAKQSNNNFAVVVAYERLILVYLRAHSLLPALSTVGQALPVAALLEDRKHEAQLFWYLAIVHAEAGHRDQALAQARKAIELMEKSGYPEAACYRDHLQRYEYDHADLKLGGGAEPIVRASTIDMSHSSGRPEGVKQSIGPGLLRKAVGVARALYNYIGSGMKTVSPEIRNRRLEICGQCEHHTGVRCRLCGCFTQVKSWLPHEGCPVRKWPGQEH